MRRTGWLTAVALACGLACAADVKTVCCWGDSVTEGMAMPRGKDYPARLQARLGAGWRVFNSGDGGENSVTIPVRQGAYRIRTAERIVFPAGVKKVRIGDGTDNGFRTEAGEKIKLTAPLGRELSVNPVRIAGADYVLSMRDFRWNTATNPISYTLWLERKETTQALEIPPAAVSFASIDRTKASVCDIVFMGANGGWNKDPKVLIDQHRAMIRHHGEGRPYLVIIPYFGGPRLAAAFKEAFGDHAVDFRAEAIARGLAAQGLVPTALDTKEMAAGRVPPSLMYRNRPDVHLNEHGYDFLAGLLFDRGRALGYW